VTSAPAAPWAASTGPRAEGRHPTSRSPTSAAPCPAGPGSGLTPASTPWMRRRATSLAPMSPPNCADGRDKRVARCEQRFASPGADRDRRDGGAGRAGRDALRHRRDHRR
jgi:hypothetical protein